VYFEDEEGAWIESSFNSSLGYATEYMYTNADSVFFGGSGRLFRWSDEHLSQISIGDHFLYDSIVFGDDLFLRTPQLFRYNLSTKEATLIEEEAVRDMSVDGAGGMWFAIESLLHWMDLDGRRLFYDLSFPILDIESDAEGSGIWVRTEEKVLFIRDSQFWEVSLPEGVWHDVDSFDRLLVESEGVVHRFSIDRPVSIYGLEPMEAIATRRVLTLLPSHPSDITDVQVFVSGIELEVNEDTWVFSLDPEDLDTGLHQLNILTHTEMDSSLFVVPFVNEELMDVSWEEDIQPLYEEKCSECHAGASATVLVEKEDWERKIDSIIDAVSREVMPINAEPLSTEEITTIRAWKQGGFQ
jgi:hypothetical protein